MTHASREIDEMLRNIARKKGEASKNHFREIVELEEVEEYDEIDKLMIWFLFPDE